MDISDHNEGKQGYSDNSQTHPRLQTNKQVEIHSNTVIYKPYNLTIFILN